jgi:hypothetical protein
MTVDPNVLDLSTSDRMVFMLLWMVTDDAGRFSARPRELATRIGWTDGIRQLTSTLRRLEATGYVRLYEVDGQQFGELADYAESAKLNNRQPGVYPAPVEPEVEPEVEPQVEPQVEPRVKPQDEARVEPQAEKEERRKEKEEKPASSAGSSTGSKRAREIEAEPSLGVSLDPRLPTRLTSEVDMSADVRWPSPQVAMAVRQWRGQLATHQQGQRDVAHVTDVSLLGLVERWGADAFESAVVRHVGESAKKGLWSTPFTALATRCKWAADDVVEDSGIVRSTEAPGVKADETPSSSTSTPELSGSRPAWWSGVMGELQQVIESRSDWLSWLRPLDAIEHAGGLAIVCPDVAHATMVESRWRGLIEAAVCVHTSAPVSFVGSAGLIRAVA